MERARVGAWAGVLSGIGLIAEASCFMASGWSTVAFSSFDGAAEILRDGGGLLRLASVFGVFNLALLALFFAGLADHFDRTAPALGGAVFCLGLAGVAIHAIVPIGFYMGVPFFAALQAGPVADASWNAFKLMQDVAQGAGILFMGLAATTVGIAAISGRVLSRPLGAVALLAGAVGIVSPFIVSTPLGGFVGIVATSGIVTSIVFRIWGGLSLNHFSAPRQHDNRLRTDHTDK